MDKPQAARDIITAALPHVPFDGWTMRALNKGAVDAGYSKTDVIRVFPGGAMQALDTFLALSDKAMEAALAQYHLDSMKIRERITLAVRLRIELHEGHPEALRRAVSVLMLPPYLPRAMKSIYRTVDSIWHAIGDKSTDFNFYSKRATLAAVYLATLHFWMNDHSAGHQASWAFLDRRIEDVMKIEKFKYNLFKKIA
ncbi:MAG: COQ9 family protein [Alphaproteobacteria bacterium]|nr:COQ9 family protein [Alphaproteobacteria bacterium]